MIFTTFVESIPAEMWGNAPSAAAIITVVVLFLKDRRAERKEFTGAMKSIVGDVRGSNERVELAMTKLLDAKALETTALVRLTERIDARLCPALQVRGGAQVDQPRP